MSDLYQKVVNTPVGKSVVSALNLPAPVLLERYESADAIRVHGNVLLGGSTGAELLDALSALFGHPEAHLFCPKPSSTASGGLARAQNVDLAHLDEKQRFKALVFDASGIESSQQLKELYEFYHPTIGALSKCGRVLVVGTDPAECDPGKAAAQQALLGFVKSVGKEVGKKGATANLVYVKSGATSAEMLRSSVEFFTSPRSAYVSGQSVVVTKAKVSTKGDESTSLVGKTALVTGASRGIGESIAGVLARYGATVICLDVPQAEEDLKRVAGAIDGLVLSQDITQAEAPERIAQFITEHTGGLDIVVHNAGVTRDKTLGRMKAHFWDLLMDINLTAMERMNQHFLEKGVINKQGRIVCVASISGIAGNFGQSNYAASKSGVIGYVESMSKHLDAGMTINAVAPGFIETQMTAAIPFAIREAGRRMNSLSQGGQPVDVAETIAYFASPYSQSVNGNVVRVCGLSLIGR